MVIATMLFMCAEMLLATCKAMLPQKAGGETAAEAAREEALV
jgi:hypothetical protein